MSINFTPSKNWGVDVFPMPYDSNHKLEDPHGQLRRWVQDNIHSKNQCTLLRTRASKVVDKYLRWFGNKNDNFSRDLFSTWLLQRFHDHIRHSIWERNYLGFPLVDMWHSLEQNVFHPYVHILKWEPWVQVERFRTLVNWLLSDEAMEQHREHEAPQNYNIPQLERLHQANIWSPIEIMPEIAQFLGKDMVNVLNFLMPVHRIWTGSTSYID